MLLWLDTIASRKVRPSTLAGYSTGVNRICRHLGHHGLDKLQPEHLEAFYTRLGAGCRSRALESAPSGRRSCRCAAPSARM
jgi:hypothetical protein